MKKWTNGGETLHYWDGDNIVAEKLVNRTSVYARGLSLISCKSNTRKGYYVQNAHGDITKIVPSDGSITVDYEYDAYGNCDQEPDRYRNPFRYCGEYWDEETENIYLRARYYDTSTGRFISEDTHWNVNNMIYGDNGGNGFPNIAAILQSSNLYAYCGSNPILRIDPTGKTWELFDMYLPQWAQDHITNLTNEYYAVGDSKNEYGGFVRDDIHNQAVTFRMQFLDSKYLADAVKDLERLGLSATNDPDYYQHVYEWAWPYK